MLSCDSSCFCCADCILNAFHWLRKKNGGSVRGSPNGTMIGNFTNGTIGYSQWYHWLTNGNIGRANGTIDQYCSQFYKWYHR